MSHPALTQLRALRYFTEIPALEPQLLDWLLLEDSMTKRFEQQGKTVSVTMIREGFVEQNEIPEELPLLPKESRYWLREILLCADGEPWLAGRTVVPVSTLSGPELALQKLGKTPLGRYLFTSSTLTRDFIEIGRDAGLWGRRSRLRLSGKPLLLTELFLPQPFSPALFQSWKRGRFWRIYPRRLPEKKHSRGRRSRARPPHTAGRSPLDSPLPPVLDYGRRRGI